MVRVKICGITNAQDARLAAKLGADALGFIFHPESPRYVQPARVAAIIQALPPFITCVGVFVDEAPRKVMEICHLCGLRVAQLHGDEPADEVAEIHGVQRIKAIRVAEAIDVELCRRYPGLEGYLLDTYVEGVEGGTGVTFNWKFAAGAGQFGPIILAGGLTAENVTEAIQIARPYAVDVSSGVEAEPGRKDKDKLAEFIRAVRGVEF